MTYRPLVLLFLMAFSICAEAKLEPFTLRYPVDMGTARKKCGIAFEQIRSELQKKEANERYFCLAKLNRENLNTIESTFMSLCLETAQYRDPKPETGLVTMDIESLMNGFNVTYRPLASTECAPAEVTRLARLNAAQPSHNTGGGTGFTQNCFFMNSCYSTSSR